MDTVGNGFQRVFEEIPGSSPIGLVDKLRDSELAGAIDADEQVELALGYTRLRPRQSAPRQYPCGRSR